MIPVTITISDFMCVVTIGNHPPFKPRFDPVKIGNLDFQVVLFSDEINFTIYCENRVWFCCRLGIKSYKFNLNDEANRICEFNPDKFILDDYIHNIPYEHNLPFNELICIRRCMFYGMYWRDSTRQITVLLGHYREREYEFSYDTTAEQYNYKTNFTTNMSLRLNITHNNYSFNIVKPPALCESAKCGVEQIPIQ